MKLLAILPDYDLNSEFIDNVDCNDSLRMSVDYYTKVGYNYPWICYYVMSGNSLVGTAAYKGEPRNGRLEIAYGTFPEHRNKGMGAAICRLLVELANETDPSVIVTARTLPEFNYSSRILTKNGFVCTGVVTDEEDGDVWEWELKKN